jgi:hypothetical protein
MHKDIPHVKRESRHATRSTINLRSRSTHTGNCPANTQKRMHLLGQFFSELDSLSATDSAPKEAQ